MLLAIVVASYRQTIHAYPNGGGSYVVSRENLGRVPSLVAAASLIVDYILTVAVSVSAGTAAITSAFDDLRPYRVEIILAFIILMTLANLRGLKESGLIFAPPTYIYVVALVSLIGYGLYRVWFDDLGPIAGQEEALAEATNNGALMTGITVFALMRAFSSGAVALSGVEAVADGVPAFRKPEARNAAATITLMGIILAACFFGVSLLASKLEPIPQEGEETVLSMLGEAVFGDGHPPLLRAAVLDLRHPHPGRQHRLRRLPEAVLVRGAGRLPAPPAARTGATGWSSPTASSCSPRPPPCW